MKFVFKFLNYEVGFFAKKRFNFLGLYNKAKYDRVCDKNKVLQENNWMLEFNIEKRIQAITGYSFETKNLDKTGTCLLRWLFRDVYNNVLSSPNYFDAVMDVPLENTENWRKVLLKNGANEKQIRVFNICCGNKLRFAMEKIATENYELFVDMMNHYEEDNEFDVLMNSVGDLK